MAIARLVVLQARKVYGLRIWIHWGVCVNWDPGLRLQSRVPSLCVFDQSFQPENCFHVYMSKSSSVTNTFVVAWRQLARASFGHGRGGLDTSDNQKEY